MESKREELGMKEEGEIGKCQVELLDVKEDYADMLEERKRLEEARDLYKVVARGREHEHGVESFRTLETKWKYGHVLNEFAEHFSEKDQVWGDVSRGYE